MQPILEVTTMTRTMVGLATALCLALASPVSLAEEQPDATVDLKGGSVAVGIGFSWGSGMLHFNGRSYPFTINGLSLVDVGISQMEATGRVYNLKNVEDFSGNFYAATAGTTVGIGASATAMQNGNGVVMQLTAAREGLHFQLAPGGVQVAMK
jgi:hypothetical protein